MNVREAPCSWRPCPPNAFRVVHAGKVDIKLSVDGASVNCRSHSLDRWPRESFRSKNWGCVTSPFLSTHGHIIGELICKKDTAAWIRTLNLEHKPKTSMRYEPLDRLTTTALSRIVYSNQKQMKAKERGFPKQNVEWEKKDSQKIDCSEWKRKNRIYLIKRTKDLKNTTNKKERIKVRNMQSH